MSTGLGFVRVPSSGVEKFVGSKLRAPFDALKEEKPIFSLKSDFQSSDIFKKIKKEGQGEPQAITSNALVDQLRAFLVKGFGRWYQFLTEEQSQRSDQARLIIQILIIGLSKKIEQEKANADALKKHIETLEAIEKKLPKSNYAKRRNARISKILDRGWFAALAVFSWVVHLKNLGVHQILNPETFQVMDVQIPTQGLKNIYFSTLMNQFQPFFKNLVDLFNPMFNGFTRVMKGLKIIASAVYSVGSFFSLMALSLSQSFLTLYNQGMATFSIDLLTQAGAAAKGMVKFFALGAFFSMVGSALLATVSLFKLGYSAWKSRWGTDAEKTEHQDKLVKRSVSFVGNALIAVGFGVAALSGPVGWSLLGLGALIMMGLKATQLFQDWRAKKAKEKDLKEKVEEAFVNEAAKPVEADSVMSRAGGTLDPNSSDNSSNMSRAALVLGAAFAQQENLPAVEENLAAISQPAPVDDHGRSLEVIQSSKRPRTTEGSHGKDPTP